MHNGFEIIFKNQGRNSDAAPVTVVSDESMSSIPLLHNPILKHYGRLLCGISSRDYQKKFISINLIFLEEGKCASIIQ